MDYQNLKPNQEYVDPRENKANALNEFLEKIAMLESSGGKNTQHKMITNPESIHYGTSAVGEYGLMPVTAQDLDRKYNINELQGLSKEEAQKRLEEDSDLRDRIARSLASELLNKVPQETAAHMWKMGHNKVPSEEKLERSDRVKKFKALQNLK